MGQFLTTIKAGARTALVAVLIGGTTLVGAAPAQAQSFSFNFGIDGGGSSFSYGIGSGGKKFRRDCLTNQEIRRGLRNAGFDDIRFVDSSRTRVRVIAEWDRNGRDYSMNINRCSGKVTDITPVRNRPGRGGGGGSGVTLQFSF